MVLTLIGKSYESKKNRDICYKTQINPIDVNFHLQKSLEIFSKNLADKV